MPAGVAWPRYLKFLSVAMLTMFAGAQTVHVYYRPLEDINQYIQEERHLHKPKSIGGS